MLSLTDVFEVSSALGDTDLDVDLRALIGFRAWHMCVEHESEIGTDVQIFVIQGGDTPEVIQEALGFPITGDQPDVPAVFSIEDHGLWFELTLLPDHGPHTRIFVENSPATELGLHYRCLAYFWAEEACC
ncbi:hypothetical protein [Brevundimonas naejangsanensis]|uniref:hypothetical protein n=1 Tax=Brevundimonas naejangsanensis TaxID=588932 RepID=UPI0026F22102|nr:hypothetical protein [Brevundimonas naejangsanensis]